MIRNFDYQIQKEQEHETISRYLTDLGYPHAVLVHLKKTENGILLNGKWEYVNTCLSAGDHLHISLIETESSKNILPVFHPLSILYEDEDILVIDKPAGMPVHPSFRHYEHTLANAVCYYYENQGISYTFRCMNRLDRDTTGLTILAKHMLSAAILSKDVSLRRVHREYLAIVAGKTKEYGTIDAPIGRKDGSTIERQIDYEHGERAVTHYRLLDYNGQFSLVSLHLETGRTHQIRVHMKSIEHPLIGDFLYNPESAELNRQALHSFRLSFTHPITKKPVTLTSPLPQDMKEFFPLY